MASKKSSIPPATAPETVAGPETARLTVSPDELKGRFGAQRIPLAADFATLIDMADAGSRAVGLASDQDGKPGSGLVLQDDKLTVQPNTNKAIGVDAAGIGVNVGNGITISANLLSAKANNNKAIVVDAAGIGVNAGNGLAISGNQIIAKHNAAKAIAVDAAGIGVNAGNGLTVTNSALVVQGDISRHITVNPNGVGLSVDAWERLMAESYQATLIASCKEYTVFAAQSSSNSNQYVIHCLPKNGNIPIIATGLDGFVNSRKVTKYVGYASVRSAPEVNEKLVSMLLIPFEVREGMLISLYALTPGEMVIGPFEAMFRILH